MAAAMDVDAPSGANSSAGKKRFEVKKVISARESARFKAGLGTAVWSSWAGAELL